MILHKYEDCDCMICTGKWDKLSDEDKWLTLMELTYRAFEVRGMSPDRALTLIVTTFASLDKFVALNEAIAKEENQNVQ